MDCSINIEDQKDKYTNYVHELDNDDLARECDSIIFWSHYFEDVPGNPIHWQRYICEQECENRGGDPNLYWQRYKIFADKWNKL